MKNLLYLTLTLLGLLLVGCAAQGPSHSDGNPSREIVDIIIDENPESLILGIRGNQNLAYEVVSQGDPRRIVLLFPATGLNGVRGRFIPPDNEIIGSIMAGERVKNKTINSIVYIALKVDSTYAVAPDENGLRVAFPKTLGPPDKFEPIVNLANKTTKQHLEPTIAEILDTSVPAASILRTVTTQIHNGAVYVKVNTDGTIKSYKSFSLADPDRIVFDLPEIKSPHAREQKIPVQSEWIKQIRYFGHPAKLRLVIETHPENRPAYSSTSINTGLIIKVGTSE